MGYRPVGKHRPMRSGRKPKGPEQPARPKQEQTYDSPEAMARCLSCEVPPELCRGADNCNPQRILRLLRQREEKEASL